MFLLLTITCQTRLNWIARKICVMFLGRRKASAVLCLWSTFLFLFVNRKQRRYLVSFITSLTLLTLIFLNYSILSFVTVFQSCRSDGPVTFRYLTVGVWIKGMCQIGGEKREIILEMEVIIITGESGRKMRMSGDDCGEISRDIERWRSCLESEKKM